MSVSDAAPLGKGRRQLLLIIALFLLPPILAWLAWTYLDEQGVSGTTNAGRLISPARPLALSSLRDGSGAPFDVTSLRGRWTYVLFDDVGCASDCQERLYLTRQTRLAMNKDVTRVQRLMIFSAAPSADLAQRLADEHPDLRWVVLDNGDDQGLRAFEGVGYDNSGNDFFLVDPLGNLMMVYDLAVPAKGVRKDLQKLLKISQIG